MRAVSLAVAGLFLACPGTLFAQPAAPPSSPPEASAKPLPNGQPVSNPVPVSASEPAVLPGGKDVSQPLQPVVIPPETKPADPVKEPTPGDENRDPKPGVVLGNWWDSEELLIWWAKAPSVPPLVTASRLGLPPVLGGPNTRLLVGGHSIDTQDVAGGRFTIGWSLNNADTIGIEGRYFFLGTRTFSAATTDLGNPANRTIGAPFVNALTGGEDVLTLARPGAASDIDTVFTTSRVQGVEVNGVANLFARPGVKIHALTGYRFLQVAEGLLDQQMLIQYGPGRPFTFGSVADEFSTQTRFHGGQLGLMADLHRGPFYVEMTGKVALGQSFEVVGVNGETHLLAVQGTRLVPGSSVGGIYAQPSNMGRFTRSAFAVVPEGTFKVGLKLGGYGRVYVGYNFLYLSDAVRPGDQIDRTINPTQVPLIGRPAVFLPPDRPQLMIRPTDFWVQGLIIGLETRF